MYLRLREVHLLLKRILSVEIYLLSLAVKNLRIIIMKAIEADKQSLLLDQAHMPVLLAGGKSRYLCLMLLQ